MIPIICENHVVNVQMHVDLPFSEDCRKCNSRNIQGEGQSMCSHFYAVQAYVEWIVPVFPDLLKRLIVPLVTPIGMKWILLYTLV